MQKHSSVEGYLAAVPPPAKKHFGALRRLVKAVAPNAEERLSYGLLGFFDDGPLVFLGGYEAHVALYGGKVLSREGPLEKYLSGKGTLRFELDAPLPSSASLKALVKARLVENRARAKAKRARKKKPTTRRAR